MTADTQKAFDMFLKIDSKSFANYVRPINYAQGVNNNSSFVAVELLYMTNKLEFSISSPTIIKTHGAIWRNSLPRFFRKMYMCVTIYIYIYIYIYTLFPYYIHIFFYYSYFM